MYVVVASVQPIDRHIFVVSPTRLSYLLRVGFSCKLICSVVMAQTEAGIAETRIAKSHVEKLKHFPENHFNFAHMKKPV